MIALQDKRAPKSKANPQSDKNPKAGPSKPKSPPSPTPGTSGQGANTSSSSDSEKDLQNVVSENQFKYFNLTYSINYINTQSLKCICYLENYCKVCGSFNFLIPSR